MDKQSWCAFAGLALWAGVAYADEPMRIMPRAAQALPMPQAVSPYPVYERTNPCDVWQCYGVDRFGRFLPRVVTSPYGAYYLQDGKPYPWLTTRSLEVMPYIMD